MGNWVCKFNDLFELGKIQILQDALSDTLNVGIVVSDAEGNTITAPSTTDREGEAFCYDLERPGNAIMIDGNLIAYVALDVTQLSNRDAEKAENLIMTTFGQMIEIAYKRYVLQREQTASDDKTDTMTGSMSRIYFENRMGVVDRSEVVPVAIIAGNINDWKYVNDNYGSSESNRLVVVIANILQEEAEDYYLIGHCDGDVLNIIIPKAEYEEAKDYCNRVQKRCMEFEDMWLAPSIALGISMKTNVEQSIDDLFSDAEYEMYIDKISIKKQPGYRERLTKGQRKK